MNHKNNLTILGGSRILLPHLLPLLTANSWSGQIVTRSSHFRAEGFADIEADLSQNTKWRAANGSIVISLVPLWVLADNIQKLSTADFIVAMSSTSRFSKSRSHDIAERRLAERLAEAEDKILAWQEKSATAVTLVRPTMIYDGVHDENIARLQRFIARFKFFPIAGAGRGLRQPIHAADLSQILLAIIQNERAEKRVFNVAGGEVLSYRDLIIRIFENLSLKPKIITIPTGLLKGLFAIAKFIRLPVTKGLSPEIFDRMNQDLLFDTSEAQRILGYQARRFLR
jgi:nucleoside-diphosphate-sugar epimerase